MLYLRFTHYMFSNRRFNGNILLDDEPEQFIALS